MEIFLGELARCCCWWCFGGICFNVGVGTAVSYYVGSAMDSDKINYDIYVSDSMLSAKYFIEVTW